MEKKIQEILAITNRISKVDVNPFLYEKTLHKLQASNAIKTTEFAFAKWSLTLSACLLLINVLSFVYLSKEHGEAKKTAALNYLMNEYELTE